MFGPTRSRAIVTTHASPPGRAGRPSSPAGWPTLRHVERSRNEPYSRPSVSFWIPRPHGPPGRSAVTAGRGRSAATAAPSRRTPELPDNNRRFRKGPAPATADPNPSWRSNLKMPAVGPAPGPVAAGRTGRGWLPPARSPRHRRSEEH
jgi:hypothetical protein